MHCAVNFLTFFGDLSLGLLEDFDASVIYCHRHLGTDKSSQDSTQIQTALLLTFPAQRHIENQKRLLIWVDSESTSLQYLDQPDPIRFVYVRFWTI